MLKEKSTIETRIKQAAEFKQMERVSEVLFDDSKYAVVILSNGSSGIIKSKLKDKEISFYDDVEKSPLSNPNISQKVKEELRNYRIGNI